MFVPDSLFSIFWEVFALSDTDTADQNQCGASESTTLEKYKELPVFKKCRSLLLGHKDCKKRCLTKVTLKTSVKNCRRKYRYVMYPDPYPALGGS
jgi:hypothetical protein